MTQLTSSKLMARHVLGTDDTAHKLEAYGLSSFVPHVAAHKLEAYGIVMC